MVSVTRTAFFITVTKRAVLACVAVDFQERKEISSGIFRMDISCTVLRYDDCADSAQSLQNRQPQTRRSQDDNVRNVFAGLRIRSVHNAAAVFVDNAIGIVFRFLRGLAAGVFRQSQGV